MSLGLSHSLSRYKLKFSPDKVTQSNPLALLNKLSCHFKQPTFICLFLQAQSHGAACACRSTP